MATEVLKKYASRCGAKNADALTCTKLRKHLATLTQLFNMSENDLEQLASFMGHTLGVHRSSYRLPDDVYQTSRISKLLLLMEEGKAGHFKGKKLDEIDLNLEEDLMNEDDQKIEDAILDYDSDEHIDPSPTTSHSTTPNIHSKIAKGKYRTLIPWTEEQKKVVMKFFNIHIKEKRPPRKAECCQLIMSNSELLANKDWLKIKVFIQNQYKKC